MISSLAVTQTHRWTLDMTCAIAVNTVRFDFDPESPHIVLFNLYIQPTVSPYIAVYEHTHILNLFRLSWCEQWAQSKCGLCGLSTRHGASSYVYSDDVWQVASDEWRRQLRNSRSRIDANLFLYTNITSHCWHTHSLRSQTLIPIRR